MEHRLVAHMWIVASVVMASLGVYFWATVALVWGAFVFVIVWASEKVDREK